MAGSGLELGIDVHGIHTISLAARFRAATRLNWLMRKIEKHAVIGSPFMPFPLLGEKAMFHRSMACSTMEAHSFLCRLDRSGAVVGFPHKMQKGCDSLALRS